MLEQIAERAKRAVVDRVFPGCVIGVVRTSGERKILPFGTLTYDASSPEVSENTIYDLASVTKSIPVASLAAMFVAEGKFALNDTVKKHIPELQNDFGATIEDLLRYRVHGPRMSELNYQTFEQIRTQVFERGFDTPAGESEYTNLPAFLLGIILERVSGEILPALADKYFFGPLKMNDTTFFPHDLSRVAPTEIANDVEIRGIVHDESARMFAQKRRAVGHAGLFSTAPDLLNFLEAMLQGKFPAVTEAAKQGLGWQLMSNGTFGKTGFTGTSVVVAPEKGMGLVILSNRIYPKRPPDSSAINEFRSDIVRILL
jgi:CubicO group peptidase (beta-lactamase class C family)